jgi:hypothetical protein
MAMNPWAFGSVGSTSGIVGTDAARASDAPSMALNADAWQHELRRCLAGTVSVAVLVTGYVPYLPHIGTSPTVADSRALYRALPPEPSVVELSDPVTLHEVVALSVAEQAREILAALSLNKSQLAEVLNVSRPTVYDWFDGKEPNVANSDRLATLLSLLAGAGVTSEHPLNARFVRQRWRQDGRPSLLDQLCAARLDSDQLLPLLREARALADKAETRRTSREDRLRALGFEDPSPEQRKEQLARNIALRDWPKT